MLPLPLTSLIKQLRAAGFPLDPGREMRLRKVVHERGVDYVGRFGEMKYLLAPFVASRPEEQRNFYAFWDRYVAELETEWAGDKIKEGRESAGTGGWRWLLLPLLGLLCYGVYRYFVPNPSPPPGEQHAIRIGLPGAAADSVYGEYIRLTEGDTLRLLNQTRGKLRGRDSTGFRWRVEDIGVGKTVFSSGEFNLEMARPLVQGESLRAILEGDHLGLMAGRTADTLLFYVHCASPPQEPLIRVAAGTIEVGAPHGFAVKNPESGVVYNWDIGNRGIQGDSINFTFEREGRYPVSVRAIRDRLENIELCFTGASTEIQVVAKGHDLPLLASLPLVRDEPHAFAARSSAYKWGKWFLLALVIIPLVWWKHRRETEARREKTDEEIAEAYPIFDQGPYNIPYRSKNDQISVPADFYRIADQLRVREESEARVFDGAATIEATVSSGGFPSWRERSLHRPADYLVLVTHNDEFNQQDLLLRRLTDFLSAREAAITVYYHEGQFGHFWNKEHPQGWSPDRLYDRCQQYRLIILGNAHGLVDAYASREPQLYPDKAKWLSGWARRLVLTTEPAADWTVQELLLQRTALLYPLTLRGLNEGVQALNATEEYEPNEFPQWRAEQQRCNPEPPARYHKWETVRDHEKYLGGNREMIRWLRGLAVTGNPDWNLTIAIGRALGIEVTHDRLLQLSRIPWLAGNSPDHDLRFELLQGLSPADEAAARSAVVLELELVEDLVEGSFAQTEWQTNLAVQQLHLAPASAPQKESLREMIRAGLFTADQLRDLELAAQRKEAPADDGMSKMMPPPPRPGGLDRLLAREEHDWWDTHEGKRFLGILVVMSGMLLFALSQLTPERQLEEGEAVPWWAEVNVVDDAALEANNAAVEQWDATNRMISKQEGTISIEDATNLGQIRANLKSALDLRGGKYPLASENERKALYNERSYRLNAAYLDLAGDKETAFRDLAGETVPTQRDTNNWSYHFGHQQGLALLGLHQTLTQEYPLDQFTQTRRALLEKAYPDLRFQTSALNGLFSAEGKMPNGKDIAEIKAERDSLYSRAGQYLASMESASNGQYFDSLSTIMPVNLRTMIRDLQAGPRSGASEDEPGQTPEQTTPLGGEVDSDRSPEETPPETEAMLEARRLLTRHANYRYHQTLSFESTQGREQSANVIKLIDLFQQDNQGELRLSVDNALLSSGSGGTISDGVQHDDRGLIILRSGAAVQSSSLKSEFEAITGNTDVLILTTDVSYNNAVQTGPDLMLSAQRLGRVFNSLGFNVTSLRNPTIKQFQELLRNRGFTGQEQKAQLIVVLNLQSNEAGEILLGAERQAVEQLSVDLITELLAFTGKFGHSLLINNMLEVGEVTVPGDQTPASLNSLSSSELLTRIQQAGDRAAANSAQSVVEQSDNIVNLNNRLLGDLVRRSGGRDNDNNILNPEDLSSVEFEFINGSAGYSIETQVEQLAQLLAVGYRSLKVPDAEERVGNLRQRFTDDSLNGQKWDVGTFTGLPISGAIPILEDINSQVKAAEKDYLVAVAASLNLGSE